MPLPPALLARLRKRGIIQADAQEEIIAESYDDDQLPNNAPISNLPPADHQPETLPYANGCPNKTNPYHLCSDYCHIHWGDGVVPESRRDQIYERRRQRMLRRYPLPSNDWKEIYDASLGRYYYWNVETDEVCWLSPTHPRARIGTAAAKLAKAEWDRLIRERKAQEEQRKRQKQLEQQRLEQQQSRGRRPKRVRRSVSPGSGGESDPMGGSAPEDDLLDLDAERGRKRKPEKRKKPNDLDPMDPASYSEIPRGGWSSGLEMRGDAKTGADTTASGPLFQQRPYPAPGAVLRQNKGPPKKQAAKKGGGQMIGPMDPFAASKSHRGHDSD